MKHSMTSVQSPMPKCVAGHERLSQWEGAQWEVVLL